MNTLDLQAAAAFLHIHPVTLQEKARSGEIPGAKIGKCWVFVDVDLVDHIRSKYSRRVLQSERKELEPCHSTNATVRPEGRLGSSPSQACYLGKNAAPREQLHTHHVCGGFLRGESLSSNGLTGVSFRQETHCSANGSLGVGASLVTGRC